MIRPETIIAAIRTKFSVDDRRGVFCTFAHGNQVLASQGVLFADKKITDVITTLYHGLWKDHAAIADRGAVDLVVDWALQTSMNTILDLDMNKYGICIATADHRVSATILPQTQGVTDVKIAVNAMKQKYPQLTGAISVYTFTTERIAF